jgi:hypothetical protein
MYNFYLSELVSYKAIDTVLIFVLEDQQNGTFTPELAFAYSRGEKGPSKILLPLTAFVRGRCSTLTQSLDLS